MFNRLLIPVPFHLQFRIADRNESAFEVGGFPFSDVVQILKRLCEHRALEGAKFLRSLKKIKKQKIL